MAKFPMETELSVSAPATGFPSSDEAVLGEETACQTPTSPRSVRRWEITAAALCIAIALYTAIMPVFRACLRVEVSYNEGWNAYNAEALAHHLFLYTARYAWTTVNYPVLSFYAIAQLSRLTHDFLFTGRVISLLSLAISGVFVGLTVRKLTGAVLPSILAGFWLIGVFCANAVHYVGANDPQLFGQVFFVAGLLVYVSRRQSLMALAAVAFLFVLGGCIKHNMIDIPLAVMLDLAFVSRKRLVQFSMIGAVLAALAILLNIRIGGPYFLAQILTPREYSPIRCLDRWAEYYPLIIVPFLCAGATAIRIIKSPSLRISSLLFLASLGVGIGFAGGHGVACNTFFSNTVAISILMGIFFEHARAASGAGVPLCSACASCSLVTRQRIFLRAGVPLVLFAWLFIPLASNDILSPFDYCPRLRSEETRFVQETAFLRAQPGPALCESLLRCYMAGKPYVYDPFNSTSLIRLGKLDQGVIVARIQAKQYGAIQLSSELSDPQLDDRFVKPIVDATIQNYSLDSHNRQCAIYVPRTQVKP